MEKRGGVIGLDELWCAWNRARGVGKSRPASISSISPFAWWSA